MSCAVLLRCSRRCHPGIRKPLQTGRFETHEQNLGPTCYLWRVLSSGTWRRVGRCKLVTCFHAGFLLGLFFDPQDGGDMFLRKVGWLSESRYDRRSVGRSILVLRPIWVSWPDINYYSTVTVLLMSGAPSDERSSLSSVLVTWSASVKFSKFSAGPRQLRLAFNGLHSVISHKLVLFMTTNVRTSNLTCYLLLQTDSPHETHYWGV
jgi:hypothetical protein